MSDNINIALLGLGNVGEEFAEHFLEQIQNGNKPIEIVAVAERDTGSAIALGFAHSNVPVYEDALEVAKHGDGIDIIFDLTGNDDLRKKLREQLQKTDNTHTVIAPQSFTQLLWCFFDGTSPVMPVSGKSGY